jgi:hypothetical protein
MPTAPVQYPDFMTGFDQDIDGTKKCFSILLGRYATTKKDQ